MQVFPTHHEKNPMLAAATLLKLTLQQVERDLCFSPFSDDDTAQILGVQTTDLPFLYEYNILERTCLPTESASVIGPACSYWDMFNATICMSLLAAGISISDAHEIAFKLCDIIGENSEEETNPSGLDFNKLFTLVEWLLSKDGSGLDLSQSPHPVQAIAKKVVVDLLHMHQRCVGVRSSEFGWRQ